MRNAVLVFAMLAATASPAFARNETSHLRVTASVIANCRISSPIALNFGTYGATNERGRALKAKAKALEIACTRGMNPVTIGLSNGRHFEKNTRHMIGAHRDDVAYQIYINAKRKVIWNETNMVTYVPRSDAPKEINMFGEVPGKQHLPPGRYHDVLVATVNF